MIIRTFNMRLDEPEVAALWRSVFAYQDARNRPELSIERRLQVDDGLFLVAELDAQIIGTVMGGYDGHRGWVYSLAVSESFRGQGIASALMEELENRLEARGCVKINLQVEGGNAAVTAFYKRRGYRVEDRISMGRELSNNVE